MARLYADENVPAKIVEELRRLGHDVLTAFEAGNANSRIPDDQVLAFAAADLRILITNNRSDFIRLHRMKSEHAGVVVFTFDAV